MTALSPGRLSVTVRVAATAPARQLAIDAWLRSPAAGSPRRRAVLVEGALVDRSAADGVPLVGLGAGCPCCTGLVALRVALARTLRSLRPEAMLLLLASDEHLPRLRRLLGSGELGVPFEVED